MVVVSANNGGARRGKARPGAAGPGKSEGANGSISIFECPMRKADRMSNKKRKQFDDDPEIKARVEALIAATTDYERENVLLWEVAEAILKMERDDERLKYAVLKWRKYYHKTLMIETWAIPGRGIKLLSQSEQVSMLPQKRAKRAYRQHGLILRSIKNTDLFAISDHEKRMAAAIIEHSKAARTQTNKVSNAGRGKIPHDRQALIDRAKLAHEEEQKNK